jgi:hypothetical protein
MTVIQYAVIEITPCSLKLTAIDSSIPVLLVYSLVIVILSSYYSIRNFLPNIFLPFNCIVEKEFASNNFTVKSTPVVFSVYDK